MSFHQSQNVCKTDREKSKIYPVWCQSAYHEYKKGTKLSLLVWNFFYFVVLFPAILDEAPATSEEGVRVRQELWKYNLLKVMMLVLRQDFSVIQGEWATAAELANLMRSVHNK